MSGRLLTLVRHAKSAWRFGQLDDHQRPLNERGLRDCRRMPEAIARRIPTPDRLLCSDAARTIQTCHALALALNVDGSATEFRSDLYLADLGRLLAVVREQPDSVRHLMIVGHNPGLTDLRNCLAPDPVDDIPTFAVVHLALGDAPWSELEAGGARVADSLTPKSI